MGCYISNMEVGAIRNELKRRGLTQQALADYLGLHKGDLSKLLSGKQRMRLDTFRKIEAFLAETERNAEASGVAESPSPFAHRSPPRSISLAEAREVGRGPKLSDEERERIWREIRELGNALRNAPRITDMTDDEILGYDEDGV
jgi:transcriptional regulator with XRE-family HTH domain